MADEQSLPEELLEQPIEQEERLRFYEAPEEPVNTVFQPASYTPTNFIAVTTTENNLGNSAPTAAEVPVKEEKTANGEADPRHDANEQTVWIDSDDDNDPEEAILRQNFYLPYSDHNYDVPDPEDRVIHPQEGPFPIIGGLDEEGHICKQWMPEGFRSPRAGSPVSQEVRHEQQGREQFHDPTLQPQIQPTRSNISISGRPVVTAQPFSIAGAPVDYNLDPRIIQRTNPATRIDPPPHQYRVINDYGNGIIAPGPLSRSQIANSHIRAVPPTATIIRGQRGEVYQSPMGPQRAASSVPRVAGVPGSYQHIANPVPGGPGRRINPQGRSAVGSLGILTTSNSRIVNRPVNVTRPLVEVQGGHHVDDREFDHNQVPLTTAPPMRRTTDMAPHRMTPEQREQQINRQRPPPQFPLSGHRSIDKIIIQRPGLQPVRQRNPEAAASASQAQEDLLRSPQRIIDRGPLEHATPVLEPRRLLQIKPTDSYSAPIPKDSDQLPAQLTEDPPEEPTTSASEIPEEPEPNEAAADVPELPESTDLVVAPQEPLPSTTRVVSSGSSPLKQGSQKPTPPHRMSQEEKSAHFARLQDKEKAMGIAHQHPISAAHSSSQQPSIRGHHQDDALAVVQSVIESNKPRPPDTPKDKEAISKIADQLRFSADAFTGQSGVGVSARQRTVSGSRVNPYLMHQQNLHHMQMDPMNEEKRKRNSSGRYDPMMIGLSNMQNPMRQPHQQPHQLPPHLQQGQPSQPSHMHSEPVHIDPPHRPRGRPKGSTGPQRNRWPDGQEPIAPHRSAGGARTLPPRQIRPPISQTAAPPRNGASKNSDSESEGIDETEESWTMRCHCGMDHGVGYTVECESCKTWQHMHCMGLDQKSDVSKYICEQCQPRRLPVSKTEAIRAQKKILAKLAAAEAKKNKRKSEPIEQKKQIQQPQSSRKSAPVALQQSVPRVAQLNDYSKAAAQLLASMPQTAGADTLLEDSRSHKKARRMFVEETVEALVTTELVQIRQVILEVNGHVSMANEMKRPPGGGNCIFMYDGLMKGTAGEDMGDGHELVCIDTKKRGNDTRFTRRSCIPNCVLKHVLGSKATLGIMIVATKDILRNTEVTLPFDADWRDSEVPLECAEHMKALHECPFESDRRRYAAERHRARETEKRQADEARRAEEERRRLEEEVRRERAAKTKQMDEEAEKERLELEKVEKERKVMEREEAKKKKEADKVAEREKKESAVAPISPHLAHKAPSSSAEPEIMSREERRIKQAEEMFRRQEEEQKRKDAAKLRAAERKSQTPEESILVTPVSRRVVRHQKGISSEPSTSSGPVGKETSEESDFTPVARRNASAAKTSSRAVSVNVIKKRTRSVVPEVTSKFTKRIRSTTTIHTPPTSNSRKRGASSLSASMTPSAKRAKKLDHPYHCGEIKTRLHDNAVIHTSSRIEFSLPDYIRDERVSEWVRNMHDKGFEEEDIAIAEEREKALKREIEEHETHMEATKKERKDRKKEVKESLERVRKMYDKEQEEKKAREKSQLKKELNKEDLAKISNSEKKEKKLDEKRKSKKEATPRSKESSTEPSEPGPAPKPLKLVVETPPPPTAASVSTVAPVAVGFINDDVDGIEREASEASSKESSAPPEEKKAPKKLSIADYASRRSQQKKNEMGTSGAAPVSTVRKGFIPSTEGSNLANVELSAIPLDHPSMSSVPSSTAIAPTIGTPVANAAVASTPTIRSRTRGTASESTDDAPAEHKMSLTDRINSMFGETIVQTSSTPASSESINTRKRDSSRWN